MTDSITLDVIDHFKIYVFEIEMKNFMLVSIQISYLQDFFKSYSEIINERNISALLALIIVFCNVIT